MTMAQITYSGGNLNINNSTNNSSFELKINKWSGMYWNSKEGGIFLLDVSKGNTCLAGTSHGIALFNTLTGSFNTLRLGSIYQYSDARAKENIKPITSGLNTILQLRPVTYNWKSSEKIATMSETSVAQGPEEEDGLQFGFLAQEVETVMPDAVKTDFEGHKLINYTAIIPMLVQAVQELQTTVEVQAQKIAQLSKVQTTLSDCSESKIINCSPNPTTGYITISTKLENSVKKASLVITSLSGNIEKNIPISITIPDVNENVSSLSKGIYIVSLIVDGKNVDSKRLIKE